MILALFLVCVLVSPPETPARFPEVPGWTCVPESTVYTADNLWDLIDGAADLFLEYRFQDLHRAAYVTPQGAEIRVELYRHATPTDAFGMYAAERATEYTFIEAGTQGYQAEGIVNLFCGEYYVKLSTMDTARAVQAALVRIGRSVSAGLGERCVWPPELRRLPVKGRIPNSEQFVRRGLLGHSFLVDAFSAGYEQGGRCFLIHAPSASAVERIVAQYRTAVKNAVTARADGTVEVHDPHNGTVVLGRRGPDLVGVYGTEDARVREELLTASIAALTAR